MNRPALAVAALAAIGAALWKRGDAQAGTITPDMDFRIQDFGMDFTADAMPGVTPDQMPPPVDTSRADRNVAAFLLMIRAAEGTEGPGGYGALFGWPAAGRSFDPYTVQGHPKVYFNYTDKAGKTVKTSPAGAYQIVYTTWTAYAVPFLAWAAINGYAIKGFTPATQDAFAIFLLYLDGALEHVKAGRLAAAMPIAARRWASLPGYSADNNPERTKDFVENSYKAAGGVIA